MSSIQQGAAFHSIAPLPKKWAIIHWGVTRKWLFQRGKHWHHNCHCQSWKEGSFFVIVVGRQVKGLRNREAVGTARARTKTSHRRVDPPLSDSHCPCILETQQVLSSALFIISHYLLVGRRPSGCASFACRPCLYKGINAREYNARALYVITA